MNEMLLIVSMLAIYGGILLLYRIFGKEGMYLWTVVATICANIEVLIMVDAFGMEMTLGNILFASTFLVTDILSELYGRREAQTAVYMGIATSIAFVLLSQSWMLYVPNGNDFAMPSIRAVFSNTPRLMLVGILVYAVAQTFDVWAYHAWWDYTSRRFRDTRRFLWLRNNGSTLLSQLLNTVLFTWGAFWGVYEAETLVSIAAASYIIFIATSLADTPFVYLARALHDRQR